MNSMYLEISIRRNAQVIFSLIKSIRICINNPSDFKLHHEIVHSNQSENNCNHLL